MNNTTDRTANEMFFQIVALLLSIIIIHTIYVTVIRPNAENIINKHTEEMEQFGNQQEKEEEERNMEHTISLEIQKDSSVGKRSMTKKQQQQQQQLGGSSRLIASQAIFMMPVK